MIEIRINETDSDMLELVSIFKGRLILWGVVHADCLGDLELTKDDLENREYHLEAVETGK